jgi:hypothetical protein
MLLSRLSRLSRRLSRLSRLSKFSSLLVVQSLWKCSNCVCNLPVRMQCCSSGSNC